MDNAREQLTKEEEQQATQGGINMARYRINRMKTQYGEAPLSDPSYGWAIESMRMTLAKWERMIQQTLELKDYFDVVEYRVAKLHMRRALILMRESNQWLSEYPDLETLN